MFEGLFQPMHLLVIFGIALLVFGPKKLPELGKGIGEGIRGFKSALKVEEEEPAGTTTAIANSRSVKVWVVGFGTEIRAKGEFEKASRGFKSQLLAELETASQDRTDDQETESNWFVCGATRFRLHYGKQ
jgi:sec-independent protein translocase protein TatA